MRTRLQLLVVTFVAGLALSQLLWAQGTRIEPGKLQIQSFADDALNVLGGVKTGSTIRQDQNGALIIMKSTGAAANAGLWYFQALNPGFRIGAANDDLSGQNDAVSFGRGSGSTLTGMTVNPHLNSSVVQPGFLAYNSISDIGQSDNAPIDVDTEVYDTASNFASDTFTAPVTGVYQLCAGLGVASSAAVDSGLILVTSNGSFSLGVAESANGFVALSSCLHINLTASDTATLLLDTNGTVDVSGVVSQIRFTWFSGRLVP